MKTLQIIGPYFTNYSLAKVNRELAKALSDFQNQYKVYLWCDPDKIDWQPSEKELKSDPALDKLVLREKTHTDIAIYNNFPKNIETPHGLAQMPSNIKLIYVAWEESIYPKHWVDEINQNLHAVLAATKYVEEILKNAGVTVPIKVIRNGLTKEQMQKSQNRFEYGTSKKFIFSHVSTARKRKGVDVLLEAYNRTFSKEDDVALAIKSFPGPDNLVDQLLQKYSNPESPEVIHFQSADWSDQKVRDFIASSQCAVYPTRAEGFGLPIAESMVQGVPVIATGFSGHTDFFDESSGYEIDFELVDAVDSELVNVGAKWAEPSVESLSNKMKEVYRAKMTEDSKEKSLLNKKITQAQQNVSGLGWRDSAESLLEFLPNLEAIAHLKSKKIAVITPFNSEDGVAEYTKNLFSNFINSFKNFYIIANSDIADRVTEDEEYVYRTWEMGTSDMSPTLQKIKDLGIEYVNIQYHSGAYFPIHTLDELIVQLKKSKIHVSVDLHSVLGDGFDHIKSAKNLNQADLVVMHNKTHQKYATRTLSNTIYLPLASQFATRRDRDKVRESLGLSSFYPIISTHGLLNKNKNVLEIIKAIQILKNNYPNILFMGLNAVTSNNSMAQGLYNEILEYIKAADLEGNVLLFKDFMDRKVIHYILQASDAIVLAYSEVGESSSDAVRTCMATFRPIAISDINMFSELDSEVLKFKKSSPDEIAEALGRILNLDDKVKFGMKKSMQIYVEKNSFVNVGVELLKNLDH